MMYHCINMGSFRLLHVKIIQQLVQTNLRQLFHDGPKNSTVAMTTPVVEITSSRLGQVTCFISTRTSCRNSRVFSIVPVTFLVSSEPFPPCDSSLLIFTARVAINPFHAHEPLAAQRQKSWQGRRDSNPHTRFWRPES